MNEFTKKYQVWELSEGSSYSLKEFDTLNEAVSAPKYSNWYITKRVVMAITDTDEVPVPTVGITRPVMPTALPQIDDEEHNSTEDAYLRGATGSI